MNAVALILFLVSTMLGVSANLSAQVPAQDSAHIEFVESELERQNIEYGTRILVRLGSGDLVSGAYDRDFTDEEGWGIVVQTELGETHIYASQIRELVAFKQSYLFAHNVFLIPSAVPISSHHSISLVDLLAVRASIGITDYVNVHVSRTLIPTIESHRQLSNATVLFNPAPTTLGDIQTHLGLGLNIAFAQDDNRLLTGIVSATFENQSSLVTGVVGYTFEGVENRSIAFGTLANPFDFTHPTGSLTLAVGVDSQISGYHNLRFLSELWMADVLQPSRMMLSGGLRYHTTHFSFDAGLAVVPAPALFPLVNVSYTPGELY